MWAVYRPFPRVAWRSPCPTFGRVLVAQRRAGSGVPEPTHQLGERGAGLGGQDGAGVPGGRASASRAVQRPHGHRRSPTRGASWSLRVRRGLRWRGARLRWEQESVSAGFGVLEEVFADHREQVRRDRHVTGAGVRLRRPDVGATVGAYDGAADAEDAGLRVDVAAAQLGQLAEAE